MRLSGLNAVVTGAASGLGRAAALGFLREGARVVFADIDGAGAERAARAADPTGRLATACACDITDAGQCAALIEAAEAFFAAPVDIFLAHAGIGFAGPLLDASPDQIRRPIEVNVVGSILSAQAALRSLVQSRNACLLFTGSVQSLIARANRSVYTATKHAVAGLAKSLALEFGPLGVRVNVIAPSAIDTPMLRTQLAQASDDVDLAIARLPTTLPLQRMPTADDFAEAAIFLASPAARSITGHTLVVDAGAVAGSVQPPKR